MPAFLPPAPLPHHLRTPARHPRQKPTATRRPNRPKRPRPQNPPDPVVPTPPPVPPSLKTPDKTGITPETRLREELQNPLRKPRQTLYTTLALSATVGLLVALSRLISHADALQPAVTNILVDASAALLFALLARRDAAFGARTTRRLAARPAARDLRLLRAAAPVALERLLRRGDVVVVAGRGADVAAYLARVSSARSGGLLVAFVTDGRPVDMADDVYLAAREKVLLADWVAWLGDAVPPRRNVALFRIPRLRGVLSMGGQGLAREYVVQVGAPTEVFLPFEVQRAAGEGEKVEAEEA